MKIIGTTKFGYIVEISATDMTTLTGISCHNYDQRPGLNVGTEIHAKRVVQHIEALIASDGQRKQVAESLRAAATIIERTPTILSVLEDAKEQPEPQS